MPQPKKGYSLGADPSHQNLMLRGLARSLFEHERIRTTEAKAKLLRPFAEKLITKAKKGTIHHRRQALGVIEDRAVVHKLFEDIGPRFSDRAGGYTRILKLGQRNGDGAPMALIELVDEGAAAPPGAEEGAAEGRRRRRGRRRPARAEAAGPEAEDTLPADKPARSAAAEASAEGAEDLDLEPEPSQGAIGEAQAEAASADDVDSPAEGSTDKPAKP